MKKRFQVSSFAAMFVMAGVLATPAWAALSINFNGTNNGTTITGGTTCVDNAVCDTNAVVGQITTSTALGTLTLTSTTGTSGSPTGALSFHLGGTPSATGTFNLSISDNGFTIPAPTNLILGANVSGNSAPNVGGTGVQGNITGVGFFSSSNTVFATNGANTGNAGPVAFKAGTAEASASGITGSSPYSLTEYVTVVISALATTTDKTFEINGNVSTASTPGIPEPASVSLLGGVLLITVGAIRRRMKRA